MRKETEMKRKDNGLVHVILEQDEHGVVIRRMSW